jgi:hypothetical protein
VVIVKLQVEHPGYTFVANLDAPDYILFLLAIGTDDVAELAQDYSLNVVEIGFLKQVRIAGVDDNAMCVKPAQSLWCGAVL